jgi:hypothetical protein
MFFQINNNFSILDFLTVGLQQRIKAFCAYDIYLYIAFILLQVNCSIAGDRRSRNRMVVGFTTIIANVVRSNPAHDEVYSIQHYVIKFVSDFRQVGCFLRSPPPIKLTTAIYLKYC